MKLKEFNSENCSGTTKRSIAPCISIDCKVGTFRINREACELIGLKDGDQVKFLQDQEDTADWYLEKAKSGGFALRAVPKTVGSLMFNNTPLSKKIAESVGFTGRSGRVLVAGRSTEFEKRKLYGILTGTLKN